MTVDSPVDIDKRELILAAAQAYWADLGFHNTTIDMIAEGAGVGKGTVYLYFKSKSDILATLLEERLSEIIDGVLLYTKRRRSVASKLRGVIEAHFDVYSRHREFVLVLYSHFGELPADMADRVDAIRQHLDQIIHDVLHEGMDAGVFRRGSAVLFTSALLGMVHATALEWAVGRSDIALDDAADGVYDLFFRGVKHDAGSARGD